MSLAGLLWGHRPGALGAGEVGAEGGCGLQEPSFGHVLNINGRLLHLLGGGGLQVWGAGWVTARGGLSLSVTEGLVRGSGLSVFGGAKFEKLRDVEQGWEALRGPVARGEGEPARDAGLGGDVGGEWSRQRASPPHPPTPPPARRLAPPWVCTRAEA